MANMNSIAGFQNFTQAVTVNTEVGCLVTAAGAYPGYPSPSFPVGTVLTASVPPDIATGELDGHPFEIVLSGTALTAGSYTLQFGVYQTSAANLAVIGTAGQVTSAGAHGTGSTLTLSGLSTATTISTTTANFTMRIQAMWDSVSKVLSLFTIGAFQKGVILAAPAPLLLGTQQPTLITSVGLTDLNFWPAFTFGTAGANSVTVREFFINRV